MGGILALMLLIKVGYLKELYPHSVAHIEVSAESFKIEGIFAIIHPYLDKLRGCSLEPREHV